MQETWEYLEEIKNKRGTLTAFYCPVEDEIIYRTMSRYNCSFTQAVIYAHLYFKSEWREELDDDKMLPFYDITKLTHAIDKFREYHKDILKVEGDKIIRDHQSIARPFRYQVNDVSLWSAKLHMTKSEYMLFTNWYLINDCEECDES